MATLLLLKLTVMGTRFNGAASGQNSSRVDLTWLKNVQKLVYRVVAVGLQHYSISFFVSAQSLEYLIHSKPSSIMENKSGRYMYARREKLCLLLPVFL